MTRWIAIAILGGYTVLFSFFAIDSFLVDEPASGAGSIFFVLALTAGIRGVYANQYNGWRLVFCFAVGLFIFGLVLELFLIRDYWNLKNETGDLISKGFDLTNHAPELLKAIIWYLVGLAPIAVLIPLSWIGRKQNKPF